MTTARTTSTMAGMAFANAFLGVCHSMAHKLGAFHHLPHGVANALMMTYVIRFNSEEVPPKMGTFPQYGYPHTRARYAEVADYIGIKGKDDAEKVENLIKEIEARSRNTASTRRTSSTGSTRCRCRRSTTSARARTPATR